MVLDAVANFVRGNTDAAVDNSQTTISVVDASIFPDPAAEGEYNVVIWDAANFPRPDQDPDTEILRVTAIDTTNDNLTVTRGQETTDAAAHASGSAIHLSPTAKMFSDIESEYTAQGENFDGEGTSEFSNLQSLGVGFTNTEQTLATLSVADSSTAQTIPNDTITKVEFNSESSPAQSDIFSVDLQNNEIVVNESGVYHIDVRVRWNNDTEWSTGDLIEIFTYVGGSINSIDSFRKTADQKETVETSVNVELSAGDSIDTRVNQESGADKTLNQDESVASELFEFTVTKTG